MGVSRATTNRRKRSLSTTIMAVSLAPNGLLLGKIVIVDPNIPLQPYCYLDHGIGFSWDRGDVYLDGVSNRDFRDAATDTALAHWTYFGFRRTEEQIYVSLVDYVTKGKEGAFNIMRQIVWETHNEALWWLKNDPAYMEYLTEHGSFSPPSHETASSHELLRWNAANSATLARSVVA